MSTEPQQGTDKTYSPKEFNPETGERVFNVEELKTAVGTLQGHFDAFANELKIANDLVISDVNASCEHCVFGDHGQFMLNLWKENASTFHDFNANFEKWSQAIAVIANKNADFTNVATDIYNNRKYSDNALSITASTYKRDEDGNIILDADGNPIVETDYNKGSELRADIIDDNAIIGTDANGNQTIGYFDEDGTYILKTVDADGNVVSIEKSYYQDTNGDGIGDKLVVKKYNADGTTCIETTETQFDDFGRAILITSTIAGVTTTTSNAFDDSGRLVSTVVKDANGNELSSTHNTYDDKGNLVKVETKENGQVTYSQETKYNKNGLVESVTTTEGGKTTTETYEYGESRFERDADGNIMVDENGNPIVVHDPDVKTTTVVEADGTTTTTIETTTTETKNILGDDGVTVVGTETTTTTTTTDGDGNSIGSQTSTTTIEGDKTTTETTTYDKDGNETGKTTTETTVTESGSSQKITSSGAGGSQTSVETSRNADGKITEVTSTDKDGNTSTIKYDKDGNPLPPEYKDKDGNTLDENPGSFNEDGSLKGKGENTGDGDGTDDGNGDGNDEGQTPGTQPDTEPSTPETQPGTEVETTPGTEAQEPGTEVQTTPGTETNAASVTLTSGDAVSIDNKSYNVYGFTKTADGQVVTMYADKEGYLYYQDANGNIQQVMETYKQYQGGTSVADVSVPATINSVDASHPQNIRGYTVPQQSSLQVGDLTVASSSDIIGSATFENGSLSNGVSITDGNGTAYTGISVDNTVSTNGTVLDSYEGNINQVVNGDTVVTAASMSDFTNYVTKNPDSNIVIRIPQGQTVQWDPSASVTGYDFDTSDGAVYLKWNSQENGYQMVDEYGNVTNNKVFTLDGFNTDAGKWK